MAQLAVKLHLEVGSYDQRLSYSFSIGSLDKIGWMVPNRARTTFTLNGMGDTTGRIGVQDFKLLTLV